MTTWPAGAHIALSSNGRKVDSIPVGVSMGRLLVCAYDYTNHNPAAAVETSYFLDEQPPRQVRRYRYAARSMYQATEEDYEVRKKALKEGTEIFGSAREGSEKHFGKIREVSVPLTPGFRALRVS